MYRRPLALTRWPAASALGVLLILLLAGCQIQDETTVLKLAHALDTGHSVHKGMVFMGERLEHYSDGKMRVYIYPSGQLGA